MRTNEPKLDPDDPLVDLGYETRDVNYKSVAWAAVGFFVFAFAMFGLGWIYFAWRVGDQGIRNAETILENRPLPPAPHPILQTGVSAKTDMMLLRQRETQMLTSTGYVDKFAGIVHIPIDRAIDMVAAGNGIKTGRSVPAQSRGNTTDQMPATAPEARDLPKATTPEAPRLTP